MAAKVGDEEGSWILGNVLEYDPINQVYTVQDEDDANRVVLLPFNYVCRLQDSSAYLRRGDLVLAVFPVSFHDFQMNCDDNGRSLSLLKGNHLVLSSGSC